MTRSEVKVVIVEFYVTLSHSVARRFPLGCTVYFPQKIDDPILVIALNIQANLRN